MVDWLRRVLSVNANRGSVAVGGDITDSTINIYNLNGITPELLEALRRPYEELSEKQKKKISQLEAELHLNQHQVREALDIIGEAHVPPERVAAKLVEIAEQFKILQAAAAAHSDDTPEITALKAEANEAVEAGHLIKADTLLAEAVTRASDRHAVTVGEMIAQRGEIALTRLRYGEAATHFAHAAALFPSGSAHEDKLIGYLEKEAEALYRHGDEFGDNGALLSAVERLRRLVELKPREHVPLD